GPVTVGGWLRFSRGSAAAFQGTFTGTAPLELAGGAFIQTGNVQVGGTLLVSGGVLAPSGHALGVAGSLTTSASGALQMTVPTDSVDIAGSAAFGGGLGVMNAGVIRLAGNFAQTGTANFQGQAQSAAVAHRVVLSGPSGTQTISFTDPTTSFFRRLWIAKGAGSGVTILTDVRTTYFGQATPTTGFTGVAGPPITRLIADTIAGIGGGSNLTSPLVVVLGGVSSGAGVFTDSGTVAVDTVVYAGTGEAISTSTGPGSIVYKSIRVSGTAAFVFGMALANDLVVDGAGADATLNGNAVTVTGNLVTRNGGVLTMNNAKDVLNVSGSTTFGGGASVLTAGNMSLSGNFTQNGVPNAFAPTGTFVTLSGGAAAQVLAFTDAANSFFRRLTVSKTAGGVVLATNVRASFFRIVSATAVTGPTARLLTDTVYSPSGASSITPLAVEITSVLGDSAGAGFSPDTTVYTGVSQAISQNNTFFTPYAFKSIRIAQSAGTASAAGPLTIANDLVVSSGAFSLARFPVLVTGNFRTEAGGILVMTSPTDSLAVAGNVTFAGAPTAGTLTTGVISLGGNFVQAGLGPIFAPSGSHRVRFGRPNGGVQTALFADSVNSFFHDLVLSGTAPDTLRMLSNVQVQDSAVLAGTSVLVSNAAEAIKLPLAGILRVHSQAVLTPFRAEAGTWVLDSTFIGGTAVRFSPDTAVLLNASNFYGTGTIGVAGIASTPSPLFAWKSLRMTAGTLPSSGTIYNGSLIVQGGTYTENTFGVTDSINGFLATQGTGILQMPLGTFGATIVVRDSAVFAGGDETGQLVDGWLRINGGFAQRGPTATSFTATSGHTTVFGGAGPQAVTFANPGASASTFGNLAIERAVGGLSQSDGIQLGSNIFVAGTLQDTATASGVTDSIAGNGFTVNAGGIQTGSRFVLDDALLVTHTNTLSSTGLTFVNTPTAATQWTMNLTPGASIALSGLSFQTAPASGGQYFAALLGSSGSATLTVTGGTPAAASSLTGFYTRINGNFVVTVSWNGTPLP
ncbi:MAG TPA: hypothetical protein VEH62_04760, partial [Gemmatimonadales bacterium]|nr:hypothetical protein [Gemmatimonadales bacterium]